MTLESLHECIGKKEVKINPKRKHKQQTKDARKEKKRLKKEHKKAIKEKGNVQGKLE